MAGGKSHRAIARDYGINPGSVHLHAKRHLPRIIAAGVRAQQQAEERSQDVVGSPTTVEQGNAAQEVVRAAQTATTPPVIAEQGASPAVRDAHAVQTRARVDLSRYVNVINAAALRVLKRAENGEDSAMTLKAVATLVKTIELLGRVEGELNDGPTVNVAIINSPEMQRITAGLMEVLRPYPEARAAVAEFFLISENGNEA